jgi:hypothetical protein
MVMKVVIEVRGGVVQAVNSTEDLEYVIIDYDECDEEGTLNVYSPDNICTNLCTLYEDKLYDQLASIDF